jgi:general stress protein 26
MPKNISDISTDMRNIDFTMLFTRTESGQLTGRPMSNNGEVDYDGDSYYFAFDSARSVKDIGTNPDVALSYQGKGGLVGKPPIFIAVQGRAALIRDKSEFAKRWSKGLDRWFTEGVDTPGLIMIKVAALRIHYWDGEDDGEVAI